MQWVLIGSSLLAGLPVLAWTCEAEPYHGRAPADLGELALCDSELLSDDPVAVRLSCDWYDPRAGTVGPAFVASERYVACAVGESPADFVTIGCTSRAEAAVAWSLSDAPAALMVAVPPSPLAPPAAATSPPDRAAPISRRDYPATHPIKGNESSSGEHIYHVPGGQFYNVTNPEASFATPAAALAASYRASQR
jgi:hypothetical protein